MTLRKSLFFSILVLLFSALLTACGVTPDFWEAETILVNNGYYEEVPPDMVKKLKLSADLSQLSQVGSTEESSGFQEALPVYTYPGYPNVFVAAYKEEPKFFRFWKFKEIPSQMEALVRVYGLTSADAIHKITVFSYDPKQQDGQKGKTVKEQTALEELIALFGASVPYHHGWSGSKEGAYGIDVEFSTGFTERFWYYPEVTALECGDVLCEIGEGMNDWIAAYCGS